jgi:hypothetical protein
MHHVGESFSSVFLAAEKSFKWLAIKLRKIFVITTNFQA